MIKALMFDFSGTLFRVEPVEAWLRAVLDAHGLTLGAEEFHTLAARLEELGALPGGALPRRMPCGLASLWCERDLGPSRHRAAYTGLALAAGLPRSELAEALYERSYAVAAWHPYPDAGAVLTELRRREIPVAVVSNIGWDPRPHFKEHGLADLVTTYVLSYEVGVTKPALEIFQIACDRLGLSPAEILMVGDDRVADLGATALGCPVWFVDHLPPDQRPSALAEILRHLPGAR